MSGTFKHGNENFQKAWERTFGSRFDPLYYQRMLGKTFLDITQLEKLIKDMTEQEASSFVQKMHSAYENRNQDAMGNMPEAREHLQDQAQAIVEHDNKRGLFDDNARKALKEYLEKDEHTPAENGTIADLIRNAVQPTIDGMQRQAEGALNIGRGNLALGQAVADGVKSIPGAVSDTVSDIGQGVQDQRNFNQAQVNQDPGAKPSSNKTGRIETEDGEVMYQFTPQLFSKFLNDYSQTLMQTQEQQVQTGQQENDPLFDMIRGNNNQ